MVSNEAVSDEAVSDEVVIDEVEDEVVHPDVVVAYQVIQSYFVIVDLVPSVAANIQVITLSTESYVHTD